MSASACSSWRRTTSRMSRASSGAADVAVKASLVKISSIFSFVESISEASSDVSIGHCSLSVPLQQQLISSNKKVRDSPAALGVWAVAGVCAGPWRPGRWALGRGVGAGGAERGGGPSQRPDTTRSCRACVCDCRVGTNAPLEELQAGLT